MRSIRLRAPAKINLHLRVGPPAADGFHPLLSWMVTLGLADTLTLTAMDRRFDRGERVTLTCDDPSLPCDATNLVVRAGQALADALPNTSDLCQVSAALVKRIPMGAGLGGGSSDGASALKGLNHLWSTSLSGQALAEISARLGSDLPFFFHGDSSVCTGRGEVVRPVPAPIAKWAMLVLPKIHMPTPAVYKQFDQMGLGDSDRLTNEPDWGAWARMPARDLLPRLVNDLEAPAFAINAELGRLRDDVERMFGQPVRMSGSGSSLFTLYDGQELSIDAAERVVARLGEKALAVEVAPDFPGDANTLSTEGAPRSS